MNPNVLFFLLLIPYSAIMVILQTLMKYNVVVQINSKRKASDIEPSSSMRSKRQDTKTNSPRWGDVSAQRQNVEEMEVNNVNLTKKKGDVPSKTKDRGGEGRAKTQRVPGTEQDKHSHSLLSDKVDDEDPEQLFGKETRMSNGKGKKVVGLTIPSEGNGERTSITENPVAKKGSNSGDKQQLDDLQQLSAGKSPSDFVFCDLQIVNFTKY